MAYSSGTAADIAALASAFETWITGLGWTVDRSDVQGAGRRLQAHKGSQYVSWRFAANENPNAMAWETIYGVLVSPHTAYASGSDWYNQPTAPICADATTRFAFHANSLSASIPYHFFADAGGDNIVVVLQLTTGVWDYIGSGSSLTKFGTWTGGQWACGARGSGALDLGNAGISVPPHPPDVFNNGGSPTRGRLVVRVDADGFGEEWRNLVLSTAGTSERTTRTILSLGVMRAQNLGSSTFGPLWARSRSQLAQGLIVLPCVLTVNRSSGLYSPLGTLPLIVSCFTRSSGVADGDQFTVGARTYRAFGSFAVEQV